MTHDDHILIRIPTAEKRLVAEVARKRGQSMSELIRQAVRETAERTGKQAA